MLRELSETEYRSTFHEPMRRLGAGESHRPIPLRDYVHACIEAYELATSVQAIEIHDVYVSGDEKHSHVLFFYGVSNFYLVLVISHQNDTILGHHFLNLNELYGLST